MPTLMEIEKLTKEYSEARDTLRARIQLLEDEIAAAKKRFLPGIKKCVDAVAGRHQRLFDALAESQELFKKPKSLIFHGVRVGYMKGKGEFDWDDDAALVKLIKKHFPDDYETYI